MRCEVVKTKTGLVATLYCGDCREVFQPVRNVDVVIADPPYAQTSLGWDKRVDGWLEIMGATLNESGSVWIFGLLRSLLAMASEFETWTVAQDVIWEKRNGSGFLADRFRRVHEIAAHLYRGRWEPVHKFVQTTPDAVKKTVRRKARPAHMGDIERGSYASEDGGPRLQRSVIHARSCHGRAIHPTQKPVEVVYPLVAYSSPPGGLVAAPFMGSGTDVIAAFRRGCNAVASESDPEMFERALARIRAEAAQGKLFA